MKTERSDVIGPASLRESICADHERLDAVSERLLARVCDGDYDEIRETWKVFEHDFCAHLAEEERRLLPLVEHGSPREAEAIRAEHRRLCHLIEQLGLEIDLHTLRTATVDELVHALRRHAAREEASFHRWADAPLTEAARRTMLTRVRDAFAHLAGQVD